MMRFISEDTYKGKIEEPQSLNLYAYCSGNPIRYVDPTGHEHSTPDGGGTGKYVWHEKKTTQKKDKTSKVAKLIETAKRQLEMLEQAAKTGTTVIVGAAIVGVAASNPKVQEAIVKGGSAVGTTQLANNLAKYGDDFGKMGKYVKNPNINVNWNEFAEHGLARMAKRGVTQDMVETWVKNGKALLQNGGDKFAFITKEGVAVVSKEGKLITAWGKANFDDAMMEIVEKLFGK